MKKLMMNLVQPSSCNEALAYRAPVELCILVWAFPTANYKKKSDSGKKEPRKNIMSNVELFYLFSIKIFLSVSQCDF